MALSAEIGRRCGEVGLAMSMMTCVSEQIFDRCRDRSTSQQGNNARQRLPRRRQRGGKLKTTKALLKTQKLPKKESPYQLVLGCGLAHAKKFVRLQRDICKRNEILLNSQRLQLQFQRNRGVRVWEGVSSSPNTKRACRKRCQRASSLPRVSQVIKTQTKKYVSLPKVTP